MTVKKGKIGREDIQYGSGSFTRTDRTGNPLSLTKVIDPSVEHNEDGTHNKLTQVTDPWVDVRAYGVTTSNAAADNDTALTAAFTDMAAGKTLFFPAGTFKFSSTLTFKSYYTIAGMGRNATTLQYEGSGIAIQNDSVLTDYPALRGFKLTDNGTGTVGLDLGHCRHGLFSDLSIQSFTNNIKLHKPDVGIANYYNRLLDVLSFNSTTGFLLGDAADGANANFMVGCKNFNDTTALHLVNATGCEITHHHIEGATDCIKIDAGSNNRIKAYLEASTNGGTLASGTFNNEVFIYRDGSVTSVTDNGWNTVDDGVSNSAIVRTGSEKIVTRLGSGAFTATSKNLFTLAVPYNGSYRVTVTEAGRIASVANYAETKVWNITRTGDGTAVVTQLHTDGSNQLSTSVSTGTVTFTIAGHASFEANYQLSVEIVGSGSDSGGAHVYPTYTVL